MFGCLSKKRKKSRRRNDSDDDESTNKPTVTAKTVKILEKKVKELERKIKEKENQMQFIIDETEKRLTRSDTSSVDNKTELKTEHNTVYDNPFSDKFIKSNLKSNVHSSKVNNGPSTYSDIVQVLNKYKELYSVPKLFKQTCFEILKNYGHLEGNGITKIKIKSIKKLEKETSAFCPIFNIIVEDDKCVFLGIIKFGSEESVQEYICSYLNTVKSNSEFKNIEGIFLVSNTNCKNKTIKDRLQIDIPFFHITNSHLEFMFDSLSDKVQKNIQNQLNT